jgi:DNA-binding transcriptional regulator YiaG
MSGEEFRALRESAGASPKAWSYLLDCGEQSIRNMESGKPIGKQMALLAILLAHPMVRALLPEIFSHKEKILKKNQNTP